MKYLLQLLILLPLWGWAQEKVFSISVNRDTVLFGNTIKVEFTLKNVQGEFEAPAFEHFDIVMGPSTSSSYSNINGKVNSTSKYTYLIKPKEEGEFFIENAYVVVEEEADNMQTEPFKIVVKSNPDGIIEDDGNPFMNSQIFNFSWPNQIETEMPEETEKTKTKTNAKRKVRKI